MSRYRRALAVGAGAAAAYLAGGKLRDATPVRGTTLLLLAVAGTAVMGAARNTAKVHDLENRLNAFLAGTQTAAGSHVGDHLTVHGKTTATGLSTSSDKLYMNNQGIDNLSEINLGHQTWGAHGHFYLNGYDLWMQGGTIHTGGGTISDGAGHTWP